ncbi:MAG TPA: hypothetical protein PKW21_04805 [Rhabdaerophilum sp.]|nr:hypothetical protein [Rhabdaerophilum sp.]
MAGDAEFACNILGDRMIGETVAEVEDIGDPLATDQVAEEFRPARKAAAVIDGAFAPPENPVART